MLTASVSRIAAVVDFDIELVLISSTHDGLVTPLPIGDVVSNLVRTPIVVMYG